MSQPLKPFRTAFRVLSFRLGKRALSQLLTIEPHNLIEPWWKTLRSLALKGRRFETWQEIVEAVQQATAYWNAHRHPFVWGRRRRHQPRRSPGIAVVASTRVS